MLDTTSTDVRHGTVELDATGHSGWCAMADGRHLFTTASGPSGMRATGAELLAASAAVCTAAEVGAFLEARGRSRRDVEVRADYDTEGPRPSRVRALRLTVILRVPLNTQEREGVREILGRCTVLDTLRRPPVIVTSVSFQDSAGSP